VADARSTVVIVWLVLVAVTLVSWWVGAEHALSADRAVTATVLAAAFVKVRLIGIHFMELGTAPLVLRGLFEGYVVVVTIALFALYVAL
jgi:heme/copper-type cytochrome/quinol oxidase subunit 4